MTGEAWHEVAHQRRGISGQTMNFKRAVTTATDVSARFLRWRGRCGIQSFDYLLEVGSSVVPESPPIFDFLIFLGAREKFPGFFVGKSEGFGRHVKVQK